MTKEEWEKVEGVLSGIYGYVELLVDGHKVSFHRTQIMTYVDGWYRGKWTGDDPETQYLRPVEKSVWKPKEIEKMKKIYGKWQWKQVRHEYEKKYTYCDPFWLSVSGIRQWIRPGSG